MIRTDKYSTVVNHHDTYKFLADQMKDRHDGGPVVFAWTDGHSTQLDILMVYRPMQFGSLQRGMKSETDLFVAVSTFGMFGFEVNENWKAPGYVGEKLNLGGHNSTTAELSELINGVIKELRKS